MMRMCLSCEPRFEQRLEQRLEFRVPTPPKAVRGIEGMRVADAVLKKYETPGILIGGLAKEAWRGSLDPATFSKHKDVDILVLAFVCDKHPEHWEAAIDWWISHKASERPTNGSSVGLIWRVSLRGEIAPGLYLCPLEVLRESIERERRIFGDSHKVCGGRFFNFLDVRRYGIDLDLYPASEFPVMPLHLVDVQWSDDSDDIASYCKPN